MLKFMCRQAYRVPRGTYRAEGISRPVRDISRRQAYRSKEISRSEGAFTICGVPPHDMFALQTRYTPAAYDMFTAVNAEAAYRVPQGTYRAVRHIASRKGHIAPQAYRSPKGISDDMLLPQHDIRFHRTICLQANTRYGLRRAVTPPREYAGCGCRRRRSNR